MYSLDHIAGNNQLLDLGRTFINVDKRTLWQKHSAAYSETRNMFSVA